MKFAHIDESGDQSQGDIFVMAGALIDAYRLRKYTATFDRMITAFLAKHPGAPKELKTCAFINGSGNWSKVDPSERKAFLSDVCDLAAECSKIFATALSFQNFETAINSGYGHPFNKSYWLAAATFVSALLQKKMQVAKRNKGLTVLICDDNKREMPKLADALYEGDPWFDPIYQRSKKKNGETVWLGITKDQRFDQIVGSAFAIKSEHSSLIQVSDAVSYVYRRYLELKTEREAWVGEQAYYDALVSKLEPRRERLGHTPGGPCIEFYRAARQGAWDL